MKKILILILIFGSLRILAQQTAFSLEEAIDYAVEHNIQVIKADNEIIKAKKKVWETTAMGLPQASGNISYQRFIDKPVNLMPARIFNPQAPEDQYIPVSFGTDQNMKWSATINQLIFSGSYITGLYSSRVYQQISELASVKTKQKIKEITARAYVNAALADKSLEIVQNNIAVLEKNLSDTRQMYQNGFVEETDVTQLEITLSELVNQKKFLENMKTTAYEMLNYVMGRNPDETLVLTDNAETLANKASDLRLLQSDFNPSNNIDYKIMENKVKSGKLKLRYEQSQMLPTVAAFYSYGKNAYHNEFNFFNSDQSWYKQSFIGISINIPLFSSFVNHKRIGQARIDYENTKMEFDNLQRQLKITHKKLVNQYINALDKLETKRKNMKLASQIESRERIKYNEGVGNSFQLNMARMQLYQAQQQYLNALNDAILQKIKLQNFLNNEK